MSKFLISHLARSIVKTARSQPRAKTSQTDSEQDQGVLAWKALGLGILLITIISGLIILLLVMVFS
jgi:hypothetical protein